VSETSVSFRCMGTTVSLSADDPQGVERARRFLSEFDRRLSRFRADSELSLLNADTRPSVPASALLRAATSAALWAAELTGGLVDPTLLDALETAGYGRSMAGAATRSLDTVLESAPARSPAAPDPRAVWRDVMVDDRAGVIRRPRGVRIDLGGIGKGLAADAAALLLGRKGPFAVDCGGDLRLGTPRSGRPYNVAIVHPLSGRMARTFPLANGGVATSGIDRRVWPRADGSYGHHILDPSSGEPVWSGLVGATAVAPSALEADARAKAAVLAGARGGRAFLRTHGGVLFHEDGKVERVDLDRLDSRVLDSSQAA